MNAERDDLIELFDFAWQRLLNRMSGLTKAEWMWSPAADDRITVQWRLAHITAMLSEERNWTWLGAQAPVVAVGQSMSETDALLALVDAYRAWRDLLASLTVDDLAAPIGALTGEFGEATRRSFVLHVVDELIHHGAEAALLRDLYAASLSG